MEADPGCCLTMAALRRKEVKRNVPSVRVGTKYFIDLEQLEKALFSPGQGCSAEMARTMVGKTGIRPSWKRGERPAC